MPDMEKVIKGIECCLTIDSPCGDCPYYSYEDIQELDCERNLRHDVLALLKEQQKMIDDLTRRRMNNEHSIDREKIIKGFELCIMDMNLSDFMPCRSCPYGSLPKRENCQKRLFADVLALIDTQYKLILELQNLISTWTKMMNCGEME